MGHLIACISDDKHLDSVDKIIHSKMFDKIYLISHHDIEPTLPKIPGIAITHVKINFESSSEALVPELYSILKKYFTNDKITDLDIAVNISSGNGKQHAVIISSLMKLGYGIRLVDLDKNGNILEMI
ncbi:MAG TPA: hypothetical protein VEC16_04680 [Alphaproteobacteria bacterium]|nr:hypothetical protein [Alphaproteobacteria bacterium]